MSAHLSRRLRSTATCAVLAGLLTATCLGPSLVADERVVDPEQMPGPLQDVRFDQHLGDPLPLDARFVDETGREVRLGDYFAERPVVLALVYYECPMLCSLVLGGLAKSIGVLPFDVGEEFDVVAISFDAGETPEMAAAAKATTVERYGRPQTEAGWHFLTGDQEAIDSVLRATGFQVRYLPENDEFAHASGIMIATPEGRLAQYFYGVDYPPKDLRLSLVDSAEEEIGSLVDQVLLYCYRYDPKLGKYTAITMRIVRLAGAAFSLILATFLWIMWRRERAMNRDQTPKLGAA